MTEPNPQFLETAGPRGLTALEQANALEILGDEHYEQAGALLNHVKAFERRS